MRGGPGSSSSLGSSEVEWLLAVLFALLPADAKANFKPPMPPFVEGSGLAARLSGSERNLTSSINEKIE